jgi:hypothetical protein
MKRWREILLMAIIIILLIMAMSKKSQAKEVVTSRLIDPETRLPIGLSGIRQSSIGPAILPPSYSNNAADSQTIEYAKKPTIPLCPIGFTPVIDPDTNGIYCVLPNYANV